MSKIINNVVPKEVLRGIQSSTINELAEIVKLSFGPNGSNTCIKKENALSRYTKDGHSIIGSIEYNGIIEQSIKDDVESITRHIVKTVGDGTTSAVILSSLIFDELVKLEEEYEYKPVEIVSCMQSVTKIICDKIKEMAHDLTVEDVYDIAMISTNGNTFIANTLKDIYGEFGTSVFIDVTPSTTEDTVIKSYNGMTLNTGYCDSCYVTNAKTNTSEIDNPEIYFFEHPIDTREMGVYLDAILSRNILNPYQSHKFNEIMPTVIFAPTISQDMSSIMDSLAAAMANSPIENRLPVCIITGYHEEAQLIDLSKMCGAKTIRKYIDANTFKHDVENGLAPTPETVCNWAGHADKVIAYSDKTTFIRPHEMFNEDGTYSNLYLNLLKFLETEIKNSIDNGDNIREVGTLKRRLHSLKSNMVELFVGGITQADRDALRDLVEDAVLNVRSAAENGVGFGANMNAFKVIDDFSNTVGNDDCAFDNDLAKNIVSIYCNAYYQLAHILFSQYVYVTDVISNVDDGLVYNIREKKWSNNVKSSIMSDITILDTVTRIVGIMATCNQFVVPSAMHNIYVK